MGTSKIQGSLAREGEKEKTAITQMIKTAKALLRKLMLKNVKLTSRKNQEAAIEVGRLKEKNLPGFLLSRQKLASTMKGVFRENSEGKTLSSKYTKKPILTTKRQKRK